MKKNNSCHQCSKKMEVFNLQHNEDITNEILDHELTACINPKCPNYGLLQVPEETIRSHKKNKG